MPESLKIEKFDFKFFAVRIMDKIDTLVRENLNLLRLIKNYYE